MNTLNEIEQRILDTNAGKQQSQAVADVLLTLMLKKLTTFKCIL